jgi:translation initiation factor IF-1
MTATTQLREGKYKLIQFEMSAPGGKKLQLGPQCAVLDIYESVLEPTVIVEIVIVDKIGMFDRFNPKEQKINIEFTTVEENSDASVKYEVYPISVDPTEVTPDDKGVVYKLTCVSKEALKSTQIKNIPLVKENTDSESMVRAMLALVETEKQIFFEKTQGLHCFDVKLTNPFTVIDEVRIHSMSAQHMGHCYVFFENSKGYHFKSLEALVKEGKEKIGDKYFIYSTLANLSVETSTYRNILGFKVIESGNETVTRMLGAGKVRVKLIDNFTKNVIDSEIDPKKLQFIQLNDNSFSASLKTQEELSKDDGVVVPIYYDPTKETIDSAYAAALRRYYLSFFFNTVAHITVYGDSAITVGDVITVKIPEIDALTTGEDKAGKEPSPITAGNYIVTKCRHILSFGEGAEYLQALEIVKDGYGGKAPRAKG